MSTIDGCKNNWRKLKRGGLCPAVGRKWADDDDDDDVYLFCWRPQIIDGATVEAELRVTIFFAERALYSPYIILLYGPYHLFLGAIQACFYLL